MPSRSSGCRGAAGERSRVSAPRRSACLTVALLGCVAWAEAAPRSVWSGVYTDEQAMAGEKIYYARAMPWR